MHESNIRWEVNIEKIYFDPYVAIYGGEMTLYGRPIDMVSAVYPVKASADDLVHRLWLLERGFII